MEKSCINIGEKLFSRYICVYSQGKDSKLGEKEVTASNLQIRKHSWAGSNFLNWVRIGEVIRSKTYTLDPNAPLRVRLF